MALVAPRVVVLLGHPARRRDAELRDDHRHAVVLHQRTQIGIVRVHLSGVVHHAGQFLDIASIVGKVRVDVVRREHAAPRLVRGHDMLHVHRGELVEQVLHHLGVREGIGAGPVGEREQALLAIAAALVGNDAVAQFGQHGLEGRRVVGGVQVASGKATAVGILHVGVGHRARFPLHAHDVAQHPGRHVPPVRSRASHASQLHHALSVDGVDDGTGVGLELALVVGIEAVHVRVPRIVVQPNAVDEVQRMRVVVVVFVEGLVERVAQQRVHPDGVGAHVLDLREPPQIGFLVQGVVRREVARLPRAQIDAAYLELLEAVALVHQDGAPFGGRERVHVPVLREQIPAPSFVEVQVGARQGQGEDDDCCDDELLHAAPVSGSASSRRTRARTGAGPRYGHRARHRAAR